MNNDIFENAFGAIDDELIAEAKKKKRSESDGEDGTNA